MENLETLYKHIDYHFLINDEDKNLIKEHITECYNILTEGIHRTTKMLEIIICPVIVQLFKLVYKDFNDRDLIDFYSRCNDLYFRDCFDFEVDTHIHNPHNEVLYGDNKVALICTEYANTYYAVKNNKSYDNPHTKTLDLDRESFKVKIREILSSYHERHKDEVLYIETSEEKLNIIEKKSLELYDIYHQENGYKLTHALRQVILSVIFWLVLDGYDDLSVSDLILHYYNAPLSNRDKFDRVLRPWINPPMGFVTVFDITELANEYYESYVRCHPLPHEEKENGSTENSTTIESVT